MIEQIEIRPDGELRSGGLTVGAVRFDVPFPGEYVGDWFADDPSESSVIDDLSGQVSELEDEVGGLEDEVREVKQAQEDAERALGSLQDEVRAFIAGGSLCEVAISRLKDALEASE